MKAKQCPSRDRHRGTLHSDSCRKRAGHDGPHEACCYEGCGLAGCSVCGSRGRYTRTWIRRKK